MAADILEGYCLVCPFCNKCLMAEVQQKYRLLCFNIPRTIVSQLPNKFPAA